MSWSIRNYNAFLRSAKSKYGLNQNQARQMYSNMKERVGRPLYGSDLKRHPKISAQEAKRAPRSEAAHRSAATRAKASQERAAAAGKRKPSAPAPAPPERRRRQETGEAPAPAPPEHDHRQETWEAPVPDQVISITVRDIEDWLDWFDEDEDYDIEDWEGTPEYEKAPA